MRFSLLAIVLLLAACSSSSAYPTADQCAALCAPHAVCSYATEGAQQPDAECVCEDAYGQCPGDATGGDGGAE